MRAGQLRLHSDMCERKGKLIQRKIERKKMMTAQELLALLEDGVENGRISPHLAAFIAAELTGVDARETGYDDRVRLDDEAAA